MRSPKRIIVKIYFAALGAALALAPTLIALAGGDASNSD
jgi:hypothetical protein